MQLFRRKPFMLCCFCFIASFAVFYNSPLWVKFTAAFVAAGAALISLITLLASKKKETRIKTAVLSFAFLLSFFAVSESYFYYDVHLKGLEKYAGQEISIEATLCEQRNVSTYLSSYIAELSSVNGEEASFKVIIDFEGECGFDSGDKILAKAEYVSLEDYSFNSNAKLMHIADGTVGAFLVSDDSECLLLGKEKRSFFSELNSALTYKIEDAADGEAGRLGAALFLGRRDRLSEETVRDFSRAGLSHSLALSGMHMAILAGFAELVFRKLGFPKAVRCIIMPAVMLFYLLLTGSSLSTVRAAVMLTAVCVSFIIRAPIDKLTVLFSSCAAIIAFSPSAVADIGFWMSYFASFGLILAAPYFSKLFKRGGQSEKRKDPLALIFRFFGWACKTVLITLTAVFSVILFTQVYFGELSLIAPISNLLCGTGIVVFFALTLILVIFIQVPLIGGAVSPLVKALGDGILKCVSELSDIKNATVSLISEYSYVIVLAFALATAILLVVKLKRKLFVLMPAALGVASFIICAAVGGYFAKDTAEVSYLRRGEREMFVLSEGGGSALIDVGDGNYSNYTAAWELAKEMRATELESVTITHYHAKHSYSVERLMSNVKVESIYLPVPENEDDYYVFYRLVEISGVHGAKCILYRQGEWTEILSGVGFYPLPSERLERSTQPTVGFSLKYGENEIAYIGSSYYETEGDKDGADLAVSSSCAVIYGTHGPNPKERFNIDLAKDAKEIIFADKELSELAFLSDKKINARAVVCDCELRRFKLELFEEK